MGISLEEYKIKHEISGQSIATDPSAESCGTSPACSAFAAFRMFPFNAGIRRRKQPGAKTFCRMGPFRHSAALGTGETKLSDRAP
jgi:hypothetical protein